MATPKTVLTELVVVALLASVPETHHALAPAIRTFHGMEDLVEMGKEGKKQKSNEQTLGKPRPSNCIGASNPRPRFLTIKPTCYSGQSWILSAEQAISVRLTIYVS